ncbi:MAG TPA: hypothetical protein VIK01_07470 [Polyangiaceae bacterium]
MLGASGAFSGANADAYEFLSDADRTAVELVQWLARTFVSEQPPEIAGEVLRRIAAIALDGPRDWKIRRGVESVERFAEEGSEALVNDLIANVEPNFWSLKTHLRAVEELLADYKPDVGRRTSDGKGSGKMSAARILAELNTLAGYPLGKNLDAHGVGSAISRSRQPVT